MEPRKQAIIDALRRFIAQRPGMDPRNYDAAGYRSESREVTKDRKHAETLLAAVSWRDGIDADALIKASEHAYSGRLTIKLTMGGYSDPKDRTYRETLVEIGYCTGQYFPTEYRKAVCAVLASALWDYTREHAMPPIAGYRVESWSQLGKPRRLHTVRDTRVETATECETLGGSNYGHVVDVYKAGRYMSAGDWLRAHFAREFGRGIASRWFN